VRELIGLDEAIFELGQIESYITYLPDPIRIMRMRSYHRYYYDSLHKAWLPGGHRVYHKAIARKAEIDDRGSLV
jgi:hypothetical protein